MTGNAQSRSQTTCPDSRDCSVKKKNEENRFAATKVSYHVRSVEGTVVSNDGNKHLTLFSCT